MIVFKGDFVKKGSQLTEGPIVPHETAEGFVQSEFARRRTIGNVR